MSYVSGTQYDFENRLHHLGFGSGVLDLFALEASNNYSTVTGNQRYKWDKEYKNRRRDHSLSLFDGGGAPVETFYYLSSDGLSKFKLSNGTDFFVQPS
jgi:hypothetical protein